MFKKIVIVVLILIVGMLSFIATRPNSFRVERSAELNASADVVFAMINDFHQWEQWSPYEKLDPNMEKTFDGADAGPGAIYSWSGNAKAGEGRMTIVESKPNELISIKLDFTKPFVATNQTSFTLTPLPTGTGTLVRWSMECKNNIMGKAFSAFVDMDAMIGEAFEEGLANLKMRAEAQEDSAP